ncbi:hypothetical protein BKA67DRAFT_654491 [Truncatella angustata]|uniref:Uncharacterized protein n=1 Tax=Truncatella angustata TaxID=152316 RepID=A0A9P8V038_9PEZI|nr:uncharacterized protein BKA67DRAFT_654491 [Truncatella angustata]KAH6661372.1 hypothetical protein BKA67DRAFT_654491 [Truncatella angustata]KAH8202153.1 hypothetical protein TruAng_003628 [Truncatella angustata]
MASTNGSTAVEQSGGPNNNNLGKDEVAWFFVEQYYTTLSKTPEKLHLFYSKRSQFVYGAEAEVADVSVGRQNIQERIKSLDLSENCSKVRISNVDSQTSFDNIVIQVIGETSNRAGDDPKKFVQTFVLAQQPSGYFVLNDILRYLNEETEEEQGDIATQEAAVEVAAPAPASAPAAAETQEEPAAKPEPVAEETAPAASSFDAGAVDEKLEEVATKDTADVNGDDAAEASPEPAAAPEPEAPAPAEPTKVTDPEETARQLEEEDTKEPEKPTDPSPTPVAARQQPPAPQPSAPAQPPKPMTWASRLAAGAPPKPVVPLPKAATPAAQPKPAGQPAAAAAKAAAAPAQAAEAPAATKDEWQTAGSDNKKHTRIQSVSSPQPEKEGVLGYVKYVTEKVQQDELKAALAKYGDVAYLDINRAKSCAFVEFASPAGYQAAVAANPHVVNGENITVEPRRAKAQPYGGGNFGSGRGNPANRGRGGFDGGRSGSQGGRGNFGGQNRGGRGGARGARGGAQPPAAA